jgi:hypothetical protein
MDEHEDHRDLIETRTLSAKVEVTQDTVLPQMQESETQTMALAAEAPILILTIDKECW